MFSAYHLVKRWKVELIHGYPVGLCKQYHCQNTFITETINSTKSTEETFSYLEGNYNINTSQPTATRVFHIQ